MIYAFIRGFIGGVGRALMDFYIANSLAINTTVLIYALLVYFAHLSHSAAYKSILEMLGYQSDNLSKTQKGKLLKGKMDLSAVDWKAAGRAFWFPLIAAPRSILVRPKTSAVLQKMFDEKAIKEELNSKK